MPGVANFKVTVLNKVNPLAPKFYAANSKLGLIDFNTPDIVIYAKGKNAIDWTIHSPTQPYKSTLKLNNLYVIIPLLPNNIINASPVTTDGAIVGNNATTLKNFFPGILV